MDTLRSKSLMALLLAFALVFAACGGSDESSDTTTTLADDSPLASTTTEATTTTEAATTTAAETTTTVVAFDVGLAVAEYAANIPEGWYAVGDTTAFKDAVAASDALVIDVRTPDEYAAGHILNAVNIPLRTLGQNLDMIPTDRQVFVYCKSGWRAGLATSSLGMAGYDNVLAYPPGWNGWTEAGEEINTEPVEAEVVGDPGLQPEMVAAVDAFLSTIPDGFLTAGDADTVEEAIAAGAFALDVRSPEEYSGELLHMPDYPQEGALRGGHIPGAASVPWKRAANDDGTFKSVAELRAIYMGEIGLSADEEVIAYCRIGERSSHTWFVLTHLLGFPRVRNYDGSWTEWGNLVGAPIEK